MFIQQKTHNNPTTALSFKKNTVMSIKKKKITSTREIKIKGKKSAKSMYTIFILYIQEQLE